MANPTHFYTSYFKKNEEVIVIGLFGLIGLIGSVFLSFWSLFLYWLSIFAAPFEEPEMFWIIIPIWGNWFFAEFYQEKKGTSFGNAVSNGAVAIFASVDWTRYLFRLLSDDKTPFTLGIFMKFFMSVAVLVYGIYVIVLGIRTQKVVSIIGKIRWVTYILLIVTPIVYNVIDLNFKTLITVLLFFPLYYWVIDLFDRITPEPMLYRQNS